MTRTPLPTLLLLHALLLAASAAQAAGPDNEPVSPQAQVAIDRGLAYLAQTQDQAGGWHIGSFNGDNAAIDSLAVMAFLARGHVPGQGPYGDNINRAIDAVLAHQNPTTGLISRSVNGIVGNHAMYDHGISTVMLCEVYAMVDPDRQMKIDAAVAKAVKLILDAQKVRKSPHGQGGWRYTPTSQDSDLSVTGWQLMALRGAANIGAAVPKQALDDGLAFVKRSAAPAGGFTYIPNGGGPTPTMTGTGILALELLGEHHSREALAGGDFLLTRGNPNGPRLANHFSYGVYYLSQAANQLGGRYWDAIYRPIRDLLVNSQARSGAWTNNEGYGETYTTAMAVLALSVPYRYLPLYQR